MMKLMTAKELKAVYSSEEFEKEYHYDGPLGAEYAKDETKFRVWSPFAESITLNLYHDGKKSLVFRKFKLEKKEKGVWETAAKGDLCGVYYDYDICVNGRIRRTADPCAKACGVNSARSMVVDLALTNPDGWEMDKPPFKESEQIIYEVHVKEFSDDPSGGFPEEVRGKYAAFLCDNTTLHQDGIHPTGLSYLKKLGVTHIQLMPSYDYGSVNEAGTGREFNWGYDPVNYNVPEGSYSLDPWHGEVRIREMKEMIQSLHRHGFRVIMDVVYNHTYCADSWFQRTVPWYYYRQNEDGSLSDGSGCGNDVASERSMCGRYILDSVLYWAEEYHMDGFRFDLMGLLDVGLMNRIRRELDQRFGKDEKLVFGEPWAAGVSPMEGAHIPALKGNLRELDSGIGIFCDCTRDAVKGHIFEADVPGFVNGGSGFEASILHAAGAWCDRNNTLWAKAPSQIITYLSSHDNLTLWDKLVDTMDPKRNYHLRQEQIVRAYKLAAAICLTSQGTLFMLSGEEFLRTKDGIEDSFQSPVEVNRLDWERAYENADIVKYYQDLLSLRKKLTGLCDKSDRAKSRITRKRQEAKGCVSFCVDNQSDQGRETWEQLYIAYNANETPVALKLPKGEWEILSDSEKADRYRCEAVAGRIYELPGKAFVMLGRK